MKHSTVQVQVGYLQSAIILIWMVVNRQRDSALRFQINIQVWAARDGEKFAETAKEITVVDLGQQS